MPITLHFQSTGTVPANAQPFTMIGDSLTVGRSDTNDMVLPDPEKMISGNHMVVENHGGNVVVVDRSTNGTFLNYAKVALGAIATPLNDGDILSLGNYELLVEINLVSTPAAPELMDISQDIPVSFGIAENAANVGNVVDDLDGGVDFLDDLLGDKADAVGPASIVREQLGDDGLMPPLGYDDNLMPPLADDTPSFQVSDESNMGDHFQTPVSKPSNSQIPDDWSEDIFGAAEEPSTPSPAVSASIIPEETVIPLKMTSSPMAEKNEEDAPVPTAAPEEPIVSAPNETQKSFGGDDIAARAFLNSAGAGELNVTDEELEPTMSRLGHVLRIMIHGMREILMTRTSIKSEFRIDQTMISVGGNNPLKFSISPEQAVEAMIKPSTKGYLDATEAAEQALKDIKAHEVAMMTGMEAALKGVLKRLSPSELESQIQTSGGIASVLKGKKARYWDIYEKMYSEISDQAENDFQELFSKEFARAYQEQLERLK